MGDRGDDTIRPRLTPHDVEVLRTAIVVLARVHRDLIEPAELQRLARKIGLDSDNDPATFTWLGTK
jgi:hypothetical protein